MIPMMVLSGAMFSFDKLNRTVGRIDKVPFIAEMMVTKWGYEALMVHQFKDNGFTSLYYGLEKQESQSDFKKVYFIPEMRDRLSRINKELNKINQVDMSKDDLLLIINEIKKENKLAKLIEIENQETYKETGENQISPVFFEKIEDLSSKKFDLNTSNLISDYLTNWMLTTVKYSSWQTSSGRTVSLITWRTDRNL